MAAPQIRLTRANGGPLLCILPHFHSVHTDGDGTFVRIVGQTGQLIDIRVRESESEVHKRVGTARASEA
jgi:hypothetical protein